MTGRARPIVSLVVPTLLLALALPGAAPARSVSADAPAATASDVRDCHTWASYPNVLISSARNMSCRKARHAMRRYKGSIDTEFRTPGGFHCRRVSGGRLGGQWRCTKDRRAFRFEFGD